MNLKSVLFRCLGALRLTALIEGQQDRSRAGACMGNPQEAKAYVETTLLAL